VGLAPVQPPSQATAGDSVAAPWGAGAQSVPVAGALVARWGAAAAESSLREFRAPTFARA
jgi:hypothetical protein